MPTKILCASQISLTYVFQMEKSRSASPSALVLCKMLKEASPHELLFIQRNAGVLQEI